MTDKRSPRNHNGLLLQWCLFQGQVHNAKNNLFKQNVRCMTCTGSYYGITGIQEMTGSCTLHKTCIHDIVYILYMTQISRHINFEFSKQE